MELDEQSEWTNARTDRKMERVCQRCWKAKGLNMEPSSGFRQLHFLRDGMQNNRGLIQSEGMRDTEKGKREGGMKVNGGWSKRTEICPERNR